MSRHTLRFALVGATALGMLSACTSSSGTSTTSDQGARAHGCQPNA